MSSGTDGRVSIEASEAEPPDPDYPEVCDPRWPTIREGKGVTDIGERRGAAVIIQQIPSRYGRDC